MYLKVTDKRPRLAAARLMSRSQPRGWTQTRLEAEHGVKHRKIVQITLPSPEHLKRIMRDAPSLDKS